MAQNQGTFEQIADGVTRLFQPLEERLLEGEVLRFLGELGFPFPPELESRPAFLNALRKTLTDAGQLPVKFKAIADDLASENYVGAVTKSLQLGSLAKQIVDDIEGIKTAIQGLGGLPGITPADLNAFANALPKRLFDYLVIRHLAAVEGTVEVLNFIDTVRLQDVPVGTETVETRELQLDKLVDFFKSPADELRALYQWGAPGFNGNALLTKARDLAARLGVPAVLDTSGPVPVLDLLFLEISPKLDVDPKGLIIKIAEKFDILQAGVFDQGDWRTEISANADLPVGARIIVQPDGAITVLSLTGKLEGDTTLRFTGRRQNGQPFLILGQADGSRLEVLEFGALTKVGFAWDVTQNQARGVFTIGGEIKGGKLRIDFSQGDGFLSQILSGINLETNFDVGFGFSSEEGVYFHGSSTLEIQLPTHLQLGPISNEALTLSIGIGALEFPIGLGADLRAELGPLTAVVEGIGVEARLAIPSDRKGNLGPVDFDIGFKPPNGVGLSVDAGVVVGGGYLFFDFDREEYAGALELTFSGFLSLKAIGIITTRMPDGSKGFSLLIIITAEFGSGLQLGFGFTLLGVGGLLGLNRTMRLEPLAQGVREGSLNNILFPTDVVANAPRIISDLRTYFPPEEGTFLIGPMAKLGWGTPTLVSLSLGIIIEIPGNIAILGVLKVALPDEQAALLILQVSFIGAIEFDKKRAWFFATMFGSRVLFITIEGEMGVLVGWGNDANFVISVGGFHPRFNPPPLPFPNPRRVAFDIINTGAYRIRVEGYFSVTSNTVQFGARAELRIGVSDFGIEGYIGFDALFQFSPFYFIIEFSAGLSVKVFGIGLFSVRVRGSLEGPTPYHVEGTGSISLLFFDIDVDFSTTWGESRDTTLPPIAVLPILEAEFNNLENWTASLPASSNLLVSLRKLDEDDGLVLHPVGSLRISQRRVPLGLTITKVGSQKPSDANKFTLSVAAGLEKKTDATEPFPMGQYQDFKDADKLSLPAFEPETSGLELSVAGQQYDTGLAVKRNVRYEKIIIDTNYKRFLLPLFAFFGALFDHFLRGAAVARLDISQQRKKQLQPFEEKIRVQPNHYAVAFNTDNKAFDAGAATFASEAQAREFLQTRIAADPNLAEVLHVIPQHEVNTAA